MTTVLRFFDEDDFYESKDEYESYVRMALSASNTGLYELCFQPTCAPLGEGAHALVLRLDRTFSSKNENLEALSSCLIAIERDLEFKIQERFGFAYVQEECLCADCGLWCTLWLGACSFPVRCRGCVGRNA